MRFNSLAAALVCAAWPLAGLAASTTEQPIIVTATRLNADTAEIPANVTVISAADIADSPAKTLPELLAEQAGVLTRSIYGNNAARATVDIRGFGATGTQNTLILLDGRRLNDIDLSAVDFAAIPLQDVERIEIIRGSGSVLYGDGAVGGTINIITRHSGKSGTSGSAALSVGSYDSSQLDASIHHGNGPWSANLSATAIHSDGYRANNTLRQTDALADVHYLQDNGELYFKFGANHQHLGLPGARQVNPATSLNELANDRRGTSSPDDWATQKGYHATAGASRYLSDATEAVFDFGYRHKNQQAFLAAYGGNFVDSSLGTWSVTPRLSHDYAGGTVKAGLDVYSSQYNSTRSQQPGDAPVHRLDVHQNSVAVYVHDRHRLDAATTLTAGARLQRVTLRARDTFDASAPGGGFGSQAAPRDTTHTEPMFELGLRHTLAHHVSAFGRVGRSVRFVTIDETFQANPSTFLMEFTPLAPQTAVHTDLGIDYANGNTKASATVYYMRLNNEIAFDPNTFANVNLDPTRRYGLELSGSTRLHPDLRVNASYTYLRSKFRAGPYNGREVPLVPRQTASVSLLWNVTPRWELAGTARYVGRKRMDNYLASAQSGSNSTIPAYTLVDVKLTRRHGPWKLSAAVNNLFNRKVYDTAVLSAFTSGLYSAYPLPERTVTVSVSRRF